MIRKYINKLYIFIQWTKKWHFCHVFFIINFLFMVLCSFVVIFIAFINGIINNQLTELFSIKAILLLYWFNCIICLFITIYTLPISLIIEIIISCKNKIQHKSKYITSSYLTKNSTYDILYVMAFILNITCLAWCFWTIVNNYLEILF